MHISPCKLVNLDDHRSRISSWRAFHTRRLQELISIKIKVSFAMDCFSTWFENASRCKQKYQLDQCINPMVTWYLPAQLPESLPTKTTDGRDASLQGPISAALQQNFTTGCARRLPSSHEFAKTRLSTLKIMTCEFRHLTQC